MALNKDFSIRDRINLKTGYGGLNYFELRMNGAVAHLYLHGAHVLFYQPAGQHPVLWQSEKSWFEPGKPIRGGIPVCWPWFGQHLNDPDQPFHGFVRLTEWECVSTSATKETTIVNLQLPAYVCPQGISLKLTAELNDRLKVSITTINNSGSDFEFSEAFHSYFFIHDISTVKVTGLEGQKYIDKLSHSSSPQIQNEPIIFGKETDYVFINTTHNTTIVDEALKRIIHVSKENSLSTVVWNPWIDKSIRMPDFEDSEYLKMVCVETANCGPNPVILAPGETHRMTLKIFAQNDYSGRNSSFI